MMSLKCGKKDNIVYHFDVNGHMVEAIYHRDDIENIFLPILEQLYVGNRKRMFVFLAGPAGCGKSTLGLLLEKLAKDRGMSFQCVGLDGFHYKQSYLDQHHLASIKGHYTTFDINLLHHKLQQAILGDCYWPVYSRKLHNPIDDGVLVNQEIVLVEGNYLLLDIDGWRELKEYCSCSIFISCDKDVVKERLIARKCRGGVSYEDACKHYETSDSRNVDIILNQSSVADFMLQYDGVRYFKV